jgi:hypothetical protein
LLRQRQCPQRRAQLPGVVFIKMRQYQHGFLLGYQGKFVL